MIIDVPARSPVTIAVSESIDALPLLLAHVPPTGVEYKVVVSPTHKVSVPEMVVGFVLTITSAVE